MEYAIRFLEDVQIAGSNSDKKQTIKAGQYFNKMIGKPRPFGHRSDMGIESASLMPLSTAKNIMQKLRDAGFVVQIVEVEKIVGKVLDF